MPLLMAIRLNRLDVRVVIFGVAESPSLKVLRLGFDKGQRGVIWNHCLCLMMKNFFFKRLFIQVQYDGKAYVHKEMMVPHV